MNMEKKKSKENKNIDNIDNIILKEIDERDKLKNFWDFKNSDTKSYTHGYHSYPAMMIPSLVEEFLKVILNHQDIKNVFDPFMGSGTTLVEGLVKGLDVYGNDLNPLSRFMGKVKTNVIEPEHLDHLIILWDSVFSNSLTKIDKIPRFKNIDYWFKDDVIRDLTIIKKNIDDFNYDLDFKNFLYLAFSETVRYVSNTRNSEFKLYRMEKNKLENWNPNVFKVMKGNIIKNQKGNNDLFKKIHRNKNSVKIYDNNVMDLSEIEDSKFDLLITSPPYGDSKTTVAYGQFSRLSNQWLDFSDIEPSKVDNELLGGKISKEIDMSELESETLNNIIEKLLDSNQERTREVYQFFYDLNKGLKEISRVMKKGSYQFWVVANRTVLKKKIPTHKIIIELFKNHGITYVTSFSRSIPRKKMPSLNSPTNVKGDKVTTMNDEIILIFRK